MKKLLLVCSFATMAIQAEDLNIWQGAPTAIRDAAQQKEVVNAVNVLCSNFISLVKVYIEKLQPTLTVDQKKQCKGLLGHIKKLAHKSFALSQQGGDNPFLQKELQMMGQQLFFTYLPLFMTMQQELADQTAVMQQLTQKGISLFDNAIDTMIQTLQ